MLIHELMKRRGFVKDDGSPSAYRLALAVREQIAKSGERYKVSEPTIYRLVRDGGSIESVRADTLEVLADVFGCEIRDLFADKRRKR